jgi:hypothetical protein
MFTHVKSTIRHIVPDAVEWSIPCQGGLCRARTSVPKCAE